MQDSASGGCNCCQSGALPARSKFIAAGPSYSSSWIAAVVVCAPHEWLPTPMTTRCMRRGVLATNVIGLQVNAKERCILGCQSWPIGGQWCVRQQLDLETGRRRATRTPCARRRQRSVDGGVTV